MMHTPKLEYYNFLDKVRKMNKNEVQAHIVKLRMHYKGEEMLEVFENAKKNKQLLLLKIREKDAIDSQSGGFRQRGEGLAFRIKRKENEGKWVPEKRVKSSDFKVSLLRQRIYSRREDVTMLTRKSFYEALKNDDYSHYYKTTNKKIENLRILELFSVFFKALKNKVQRKLQKIKAKN